MKNKLTAILIGLVLLVIAPGAVFGQTGTIEGRVVDPDGVSIPGANVALEGTVYGTSTDADGEFRFTAPAGTHTLVVSFVGFARHSAPITLRSGETLRLNVQLEAGAIDLDEVVVTALGIERQERSLGYSFEEVGGDIIDRANESNLVNALAGKVAGMQVTSSSGQPGKAARVTIRGNSSMTGNNQPLFVIDGVPISNAEDDNIEGPDVFTGGTINRAVDIDPSLIEDVTVLKGAAAMALYGSRAANGAILITTRSGVTGEGLRVTFSTTGRWDQAIVQGLQTSYAQGNFGCFYNGLPADDGGYVDRECVSAATGTPVGNIPNNGQIIRAWGPHIDSLNANQRVLNELGVDRIEQRDPRSDFYQTGGVIENSLSLSGSALGGNYFLSTNWLDQGGVVPNTSMDRVSLLAKADAKLTSRFTAQTSANYVRTSNEWVTEGNGARSYLFSLNFAPPTYDITDFLNEDGTQRNYTTANNNPLWLVNNNGFTSDVDRLIGSIALSYDFLPWLTLTERAGIDTYTDTRKGRVNVGTRSRLQGSMYDQTINRRELNSDLILQAAPGIGERFGLNILVGNNLVYQYFRREHLFGQNLGIPNFFNISNASVVEGDEWRSEQALVGLYSQATVNYDEWAYLTLTARNDWSSTLPVDNRSYFYPSASVGILFTEALDFFNNSPLSFGKVRASWARIGNDAPIYSTSTNFIQASPGDGVRGNISFPFNGVNAYQVSSVLGNPDLRPELSSEYEAGVDLRFFGRRARIDAAYYNRTTTDQIFSVPVSGATGYVRRLMNAGEIRNSGVELILGLTPVQTRDFAWDISGNWSKNTTEVVSLAEGVESIYLAGFTNPQIRIQEGKGGYGVIWGETFETASREEHPELFEQHANLQEGMVLVNENGLPRIAPKLGAVGNVQPDWLANIRTSLSFKGLAASALIDIRSGGDVLNMDRLYSSFYGTAAITETRGDEFVYEGFNVATGQQNETPITRDRAYYQSFFAFNAPHWIEDGSYVKLRELSLSYTLPGRFVQRSGVQSATITATGRNLWIGTDFSYGDPEGSLVGAGNGQGFYHAVTPGTKSYAIGLRVTL